MEWLIDTGCSTTILSTRVFHSLPLESRPALQPYHGTLRSADDSPILVEGTANLNIQIGDHLVQHRTIIAAVYNDGLLGLDFLREHQVAIEFATRKVTCKGEVLHAYCRAGTDRACRIIAAEHTVIPARSRTLVQAKATKPLVDGSWAIEPLNRTPGGQPVLLARSLARGCGCSVPVEILNPTDDDVRLYKCTNLGIISRIPEPDVLCSVSESADPGSTTLPDESHLSDSSQVPLTPELDQLLVDMDSDLSEDESARVRDLLSSHKDVFATKDCPFGRTDLVKHQIETLHQKPIKQPVRRPPLHLRAEADKEVERMMEKGVIEDSNSPWASPVVLVRKKDGTLRYCIDYRKLNAVTVKDSYPLPRIDDSLDSLGKAKYFSTLDLASGYWQIGLDEDAKRKSAFCTTSGLYQFKVMPFGLTNAPATFQRLMERVLGGLQWQICLVYIDDVIVFSETVEEHLASLSEIFTRLGQAGLKLKPKKCHLFRRRVKYLGHEVSAEGIATDPEKTSAVADWPVPSSVTEVRSFLGICSYYRRFVDNFAEISKPLTVLTEKSVPFVWKDDQQEAFDLLKSKLTTTPVLAFPDASAHFLLDTDASNWGIGAVLSQVIDGDEHVIAYGSRLLTKAELKYCTTRRELLAVVHFVKAYRHYLVGKPFTIRTDHSSLRWIRNLKEPEGQNARWLETLDTYDFTIIHRPGKKHQNADALSRRGPCPQCQMTDHCGPPIRRGRPKKGQPKDHDESARPVRTRGQVGTGKVPPAGSQSQNWLSNTKLDPEHLRRAQLADPVLGDVLTWVNAGERPKIQTISHCGYEHKFYWGQYASLKVVEGVLVRDIELPNITTRRQVCVPSSLRVEVLQQCHDAVTAGHFGKTKTLANVSRRFLWPGMRRDSDLHVKQCVLCGAYKTSGKKGVAPLQSYRVGIPMERVCVDLCGPFPPSSSGNRYAMVVTDWFTKYVEVYALPNQEAATVAEVLCKEFFTRYGVPRELHTDQGTNFESQLFGEMCVLLGIKKTHTAPFNPKSDGQSERNVKTLKTMMAMNVKDHQELWDEQLAFSAMAYRATPQESTGITPNFMMFGREIAMPVDVMMGPSPDTDESTIAYVVKLRKRLEYAYGLARKNLMRSGERQKALYDRKNHGSGYKVGDRVWCMNKTRKKGVCPKLQPKWKGPCIITKVHNDVIVEVQLSIRKTSTLHTDLLKPCHAISVPAWLKRLEKRLGNRNAAMRG